MMTLYRITGEVTAPDGTGYEPLVWADWHTAGRILDGIEHVAETEGDTFSLRLDRGPGSPMIAYHTNTAQEVTA